MTDKLRVLYYIDGQLRDLHGRVKSVEISGDIAQAYRTCVVGINNTSDGRRYVYQFKNGAEIRVLLGDKEIFRGALFSNGVNTSGDSSLSAYDYNVYLTKNSDSVVFVGKTATQIISTLCAKFGIPVGRLTNTGYVIPKFIVRGKTVFEIITTALTMTQQVTGRRFRLRNIKGQLELVEVTEQVKQLVLENGRNIMSASYSESIEDTKTRVKLTGGDENKPVTVEVSSPRSKDYGIMQHYEHNSDVKTVAKLKPLADALLKELSKPKQEISVEALGDIDVISTTSVAVKEEMTGLRGVFYVSADTHKFESSGLHTMSIQLSRTLELPRIEYEAPAEPKQKKAKAKKKTAKQKAEEKIKKGAVKK